MNGEVRLKKEEKVKRKTKSLDRVGIVRDVRFRDKSGFDRSRDHGLLPTSNIVGESTPAKSLVGHVGFSKKCWLLSLHQPLCEERFVWSKQVAPACPVIEPFESFAKTKTFHIFSSTYAE